MREDRVSSQNRITNDGGATNDTHLFGLVGPPQFPHAEYSA